MSAFLLSLMVCANGPLTDIYDIEIQLYEGDPLGSREDKTLWLLAKPSLFLHQAQIGHFTLGDPGDATRVRIEIEPLKKVGTAIQLRGKATVATGGREFEKAIEPAVALGKPVTVRLGTFSPEHQLWAVITVRPFDPDRTTR